MTTPDLPAESITWRFVVEDALLCCAECGENLTENGLTHDAACAQVEAIRAQAATAERQRGGSVEIHIDCEGSHHDAYEHGRQDGAAAEREKCAQLALDEADRLDAHTDPELRNLTAAAYRKFADLLRDQPQPAGADADPSPARADDRDSDTQPDPHIDTLAAQHAREFEPDDQDGDHG